MVRFFPLYMTNQCKLFICLCRLSFPNTYNYSHSKNEKIQLKSLLSQFFSRFFCVLLFVIVAVVISMKKFVCFKLYIYRISEQCCGFCYAHKAFGDIGNVIVLPSLTQAQETKHPFAKCKSNLHNSKVKSNCLQLGKVRRKRSMVKYIL